MPMGIISDNDFQAELDKLNDNGNALSEIAEIKIQQRGRRDNDLEVPEALRKIISEEALVNKTSDIIDVFPVSSSSVSAYKNGATSTASYHQPAPELLNHVKSVKERISSRASKKLFRALNSIDENVLEEIGKSKPQVVSAVARDLAQIVKQMDDTDDEKENKTQVNVVFYAPRMREESDFEQLSLTQ